MKRHDGRTPTQLRPIKIQRRFTDHPGGSVLISFGQTRVLCTAIIEKGVPDWLKGKGSGWLTAEYAMLPSSTNTRKKREGGGGKPDGRSVEIQRLIGRCLRSVVNLKALGENCLWLDCDVLQADGGTRTAAITGAYIALVDAVTRAKKSGVLPPDARVVTGQVAAVSVGMVQKRAVVDLDYKEDVDAEVDMNVAMLADGSFVEVQGTGEHATFTQKELSAMLQCAIAGIKELQQKQTQALKAKS